MRPGRLRIAAAKILTEHFGVPILPEHVVPTTGYWRTSPHVDVYRWDVKVYGLMKGHPDHPRYFGCWERLAVFVKLAKKFGMVIQNGEIWPLEAPKEKIMEEFEATCEWTVRGKFRTMAKSEVDARGFLIQTQNLPLPVTPPEGVYESFRIIECNPVHREKPDA